MVAIHPSWFFPMQIEPAHWVELSDPPLLLLYYRYEGSSALQLAIHVVKNAGKCSSHIQLKNDRQYLQMCSYVKEPFHPYGLVHWFTDSEHVLSTCEPN